MHCLLSRVLFLHLGFLQISKIPKIVLENSQSFSLVGEGKKTFHLQILLFFKSVYVCSLICVIQFIN